jgi:hypothetical protein
MLLQDQLVPFRGGKKGIDFWDGGAMIVLIRHGFAKELRLRGQEVTQRIHLCEK